MNLNVQQWLNKLKNYVLGLTLYEQIAWGVIILGIVLIVMGMTLV